MALPLVAPISLSQVATEFGAPAATPLSAFVKGGAYVVAGTPGGSIPVAPPISLSQFLGARHVATLTLASSSITGPFAISSVVPGANLATLVANLTGTLNNAHAPASMAGTLTLVCNIGNVPTPTADIRLPAGQPVVSPGFVATYGAYQMGPLQSTFVPAGSVSTSTTIPLGGQPPSVAVGGNYYGGLSIGGVFPDGRPQAVSPGYGLPVVANQFTLTFPLSQLFGIATTGTGKTWETVLAASKTSITFPLLITIYDSQGVNAALNVVATINLDSTIGFTAP